MIGRPVGPSSKRPLAQGVAVHPALSFIKPIIQLSTDRISIQTGLLNRPIGQVPCNQWSAMNSSSMGPRTKGKKH